MRVGILTEFPSITVQSGPAIHTRFLHDGLAKRGHDVTLIGPDLGRDAAPEEDVSRHLFLGLPYPTHPKVRVPFPWPMAHLAAPPKVDLIHGQSNSHMIHYGVWMRKMYGCALLNTHIIHLPTHSHFLLSDGLYKNPIVWQIMQQSALGTEKNFAQLYNQGDGLIVQSRFMIDYWRERGVEVPIEAIGRPINPKVFSAQPGSDPFPAHFRNGKRLICVCRHDREKNLQQLIKLFVDHVAPADPEVTLTLVGDGFDHPNLAQQAAASRYGDRVHFPGEVPHATLVDWYAHADVFVYTSLSETFGNVVNEALWCGLPVVALHDHMGVAHQVLPGHNGALIEPGRSDTEEQFARATLRLLWNRDYRRTLAANAATHARRTSHPDVTLSRYESFYERSQRRVRDTVTPLVEQGSAARARAFTKHIGGWAAWSSLLMAVSATATRLGVSREGSDTNVVNQHVARVRENTVAPQAVMMEAAE